MSDSQSHKDHNRSLSHDQQELAVFHLSLEQLDAQRADIVGRIQSHISDLSRALVNRNEVIEMATLCATLGEPLLLLGPPGTGKSLLCSRFAESLNISANDRFEYLLTPFTEPSELFGPIDLNALKEGRFIRKPQGSLPHAKVAFLDEVFKANSAILNALLGILNNGVYYEEGQPRQARLKILFAASNELPRDRSLAALSDRFTLKIPVHNTHGDHWDELLRRGVELENERVSGVHSWRQGAATYIDLLKVRRYLQLALAQEADDESLRDYFFPPPLMALWRRLITSLELDLGLYISDRKLIKIYRLIRGLALLRGRLVVQAEDLALLEYISQAPGEQSLISELVERALAEYR